MRDLTLPVDLRAEKIIDDLIHKKTKAREPEYVITVREHKAKIRRYKKAYKALKILSKAKELSIEGTPGGDLHLSPFDEGMSAKALAKTILEMLGEKS